MPRFLFGLAIAMVGALALACGGGNPSGGPEPSPSPRTFSQPPPFTIDPSESHTAVIKMERGDIRIQLRPDLSPQTVNSFIFLARQGFYDGLTFHRVDPGFVAQGGDPEGTGRGGPGYTLPAEFSDVPFDRGSVGLARSADPDSGGSQFFITYARAAHLDGQYALFGEVVEGMEVADQLTPRDPADPAAPPGDRIITIEIIEE